MLRFAVLGIVLIISLLPLLAAPVSLGMSSAADTQSVEAVAATGVRMVRIRTEWPVIQPTAKAWNYAKLDAAVKSARSRGLTVVLVLGPTPVWAVAGMTNPSADEACRAKPTVSAFSTFAAAIARRYQGQVQYIQLWDRPTGCPILAMPGELYALYNGAAKAIHAAAPDMRVAIPEAGDVNLSWIDGYLKSAQGTARADVLVLQPTRLILAASLLWPRMAVLRSRVLTDASPTLWMDVPVQTEQSQAAAALAAGALLQGIPAVFFESATCAATPQGVCGIGTLAQLQGLTYTGWTTIGQGILAGLYTAEGQTRALAVPLAPGTATVSGNALEVQMADGTALRALRSPATLAFAEAPAVITGATLTASPGMPELLPQKIAGHTVTFDASGQNPAAIHPMPNLPGSRYRVSNIGGQTVLTTVRNKAPWIPFDIPDGFLFYNTELRPVEVTVRVMGAQKPQKCGFFFYYDAQGGMASTPWQWVDVGPDQAFTYTLKLTDAIFANREGYDLRLCMGGSDEEVRFVDMTVTKK